MKKIFCLFICFLVSTLAISANYSPVGSNGIPTINSCGSGAAVAGTDQVGIITVGSGLVTSCSLNWSATLSLTPKCLISAVTTNITLGPVSATTTGMTTGLVLSLTGEKFAYFCPLI